MVYLLCLRLLFCMSSLLRRAGFLFLILVLHDPVWLQAKELISKGEECDDADKERLRRQRIAVERCVTHSYHLLANKKQVRSSMW